MTSTFYLNLKRNKELIYYNFLTVWVLKLVFFSIKVLVWGNWIYLE